MKLPLSRVPIMILGIVALLAALWAGLLRLGWQIPPLVSTLAMTHGPLMISGFLGTVITMERAVALNQRAYLLAPLVSGVGALVLISGLAPQTGIALIALGSLGLVIIFAVIVRRHTTRYTIVMGMGALLWLVGNLLWFSGMSIYHVAMWWIAFLVLTIVGERLELSKLQRLPRSSDWLFNLAVAILLAGVAMDLAEAVAENGADLGARVIGAGMFALALWLLRYDIARRTVRQTGLTRYIAICLLVGYVWLGISGGLRIVYGGMSGGAYYDAMLHTVLLGFVFSMIFGHAPIILPAVLNRPLRYAPAFYAHLVLLHASLLLRLTGDLSGWFELRQWGGMFNVIAVLWFITMTARGMRAGMRTPAPQIFSG